MGRALVNKNNEGGVTKKSTPSKMNTMSAGGKMKKAKSGTKMSKMSKKK